MFDWLATYHSQKLRKKYKKKSKRNEFNLHELDKETENLGNWIQKKYPKKLHQSSKPAANTIAVFATLLYDKGGHTECIKSFVESIDKGYDLQLFLSKRELSQKKAPRKSTAISKHANLNGVNFPEKAFVSHFINLYNQIIDKNPSIAFVFTHPNDVLFTAVIALLKKNTSLKIVYYNHASHFPALGFSYADLVLEGMPSTQYVTEHYRNIHKNYVFGLQSLEKDKTKYLSPTEIHQRRTDLGIADGSYVTMTGCASAKIFDGNHSQYLEMIQRLLTKEPKLQHVLVTQLKKQQENILEDIFKNTPEARSRLIITDFIAEFDPLFQCCDVFIDSFPISSALTQIDLMRNKKPTVIKINSDNSLFSFHEYLPKDYPYMFSDINEMESGILKLVRNQPEQQKISELLYDYYLSTYEGSLIKEKYIEIINNVTSLDEFYQKAPSGENYKFKEIK